jgi:hypothetical protein
MFQKDFLLVQLDKFFEAVQAILLKIEHNNIEEAEADINSSASAELIDYLLNENSESEHPVFKYDELKFQADLLLSRLKIEQMRGHETFQLKQDCKKALKKLISLKPTEYDLRVHQTLKSLEN